MKMLRRRAVRSPRRLLLLEPLEDRCLPSTFTVLNTDDSGAGSLRQAILNANAAMGASEIAFDIASSGTQTISPVTPLPSLGNSITLDATTEPGFGGTPIVVLSGKNLTGSTGLKVTGNNDVVRGLSFANFENGFVSVTTPLAIDGNNNIISGNFLVNEGSSGLTVDGSDNTIGGTTAAARNVISGDTIGVDILGGSGNVVEGNFIGTDPTGTQALSNSMAGVSISGPSTNDTIGGTAPGAGNLISGNNAAVATGIEISGSSGDVVQGNLIGTDVTGTKALGNGTGVQLSASPNCTIGGTTTAARNVISANDEVNISIVSLTSSTPTTNDIVEGNFIGTQSDGQSPLPEASAGIDIGTSQNAILNNTLAFNGIHNVDSFQTVGPAIHIEAGNGNRISQNVMFDNGTTGIQLGPNVYTPNGVNPGTGPNNSQNFPNITSATDSGSQTVIKGTLNSQASTTYTLEFYAASDLDAGGSVEGRTLLGSMSVTTDAKGNAAFTFTGPANPGPFYTATATDPSGNTSEFWQPNRPVPSITSVVAKSIHLGAIVGYDLVSVTITGNDLFLSSTVQASGSLVMSSFFVSTTQLQASIDVPGSGHPTSITVISLGPGGGTSNAVTLTETADQRFVAAVYQNLLGRFVDSSGLAYWSGQLDNGATPPQIVSEIETSREYRTDQVQTLYQRYLKRAADPTGLANDITFLQSGGTVEQLAAVIIGSPEFFQKQGGGTNNGFLSALYQDALNRPIDSGGAAQWLQAFAIGATTTEVAGAIVTSLEYRQDLVQSYYSQFLNRLADPGGLSGWINLLATGTRDETVIAGILGSQEYFNNPFAPLPQ
jgi:hypothetical protein